MIIFLLLLNVLLWLDLMFVYFLVFIVSSEWLNPHGDGMILFLVLVYLFFSFIIALVLFTIRFLLRRKIKKTHPAVQFRPFEKDMVIALWTVIALSVVLYVTFQIPSSLFVPFSWQAILLIPSVVGLIFYLVFWF